MREVSLMCGHNKNQHYDKDGLLYDCWTTILYRQRTNGQLDNTQKVESDNKNYLSSTVIKSHFLLDI